MVQLLGARHWEQGVDLHAGKVKGGLRLDGKIDSIDLGTAIDSLTAVEKFVFNDKAVTMGDLLRATITKSVKNTGQNKRKYPTRLLS